MAGPVTKPRLMQGATVAIRAERPRAMQSSAMQSSAPAPKGSPRRLKIGLSAIDRAVVTSGVLAAIASASFATYMVAIPHRPMFNGVEHLMIFAQPNRGSTQPLIARVPKPADDQGIDFTATGTIPNEGKAPAPPDYTLPAINPAERILSEFTLRGVNGSSAMVEDADGVYRVEIGSVLPGGGGRVLAIEWRQGRFVVLTTRGIIREAQP